MKHILFFVVCWTFDDMEKTHLKVMSAGQRWQCSVIPVDTQALCQRMIGVGGMLGVMACVFDLCTLEYT